MTVSTQVNILFSLITSTWQTFAVDGRMKWIGIKLTTNGSLTSCALMSVDIQILQSVRYTTDEYRIVTFLYISVLSEIHDCFKCFYLQEFSWLEWLKCENFTFLTFLYILLDVAFQTKKSCFIWGKFKQPTFRKESYFSETIQAEYFPFLSSRNGTFGGGDISKDWVCGAISKTVLNERKLLRSSSLTINFL